MIGKEELEILINDGNNVHECCNILNISYYELKKYRKLYDLGRKVPVIRIDKCYRCDNMVEYRSVNVKDKIYCSRSCANKRDHSVETIDKIRKSVIERLPVKESKYCLECSIDITNKRCRATYCSISCSMKYWSRENPSHYQMIGRKSAENIVKRSKNEILFFEKCSDYFINVENNKTIFNGWDADIIIHDIKTAVMWNGKWHYEYIRGKQSLKQIQNRDRIKINEILKYGYEPYIIKDMGRYSVSKVDYEFQKFIEFIKK